MITFDLACKRGHRFEGWFGNREDFDAQVKRGLLTCPLCGSADVEKLPSPVAVHTARRAETAAPPGPAAGPAPPPKAFFQALTEFVENHFEDVGPSFAAEARRIEEGEVERRNIRGTTTPAEEEALRDDGIEFHTLRLPKYDA